MEPGVRVAEVVRKVSSVTEPRVWIRHYNFVDFQKYGSDWSPDWFNMVRDPVDRVSIFISGVGGTT